MSNDDNVIDFSAQIKKLKNLRPYRDKSDEYLLGVIKARKPKGPKVPKSKKPKLTDYEAKFNQKLANLQHEFALDMNNSNDVEMLKNLVRHQIQLEKVNYDIDDLQSQDNVSGDEAKRLKSLGDFQRTVQTSITELQEKLGISRKQRKEKQSDDVPQWIDSVLTRAKTFYDKKTIQIECPKCQIELARFWLNFPREENELDLSLTCWKCKEKVMYLGG